MRAFLLLSLLFALPATAGDLRCEGRLVARGLTPYEVIERCGEAVYEDRRVEFLYEGVPVYVDEWLYDLGDNRFRRLLRFENGRLRKVELLRKPLR